MWIGAIGSKLEPASEDALTRTCAARAVPESNLCVSLTLRLGSADSDSDKMGPAGEPCAGPHGPARPAPCGQGGPHVYDSLAPLLRESTTALL